MNPRKAWAVMVLGCILSAGLAAAEQTPTAEGQAGGWTWKGSKGSGGSALGDGGVRLTVGQFDNRITATLAAVTVVEQGAVVIHYRSANTTVDAGITGCAEAAASTAGGRQAATLAVADDGEKTARIGPFNAGPVQIEIGIKDRITTVEILKVEAVGPAFTAKVVFDFENEASVKGDIAEQSDKDTEITWSKEAVAGAGALHVKFGASGQDDGKHVGFRVKDSDLRDVSGFDSIALDVKNIGTGPADVSGQVADDPWKKIKPRLFLQPGKTGRLLYPIEAMKKAGMNPQRIASLRVFVWGNLEPVNLLIDNVRLIKGDEPEPGIPVTRTAAGEWTILAPAALGAAPKPTAAEAALGAVPFQVSTAAMLFPYTRPAETERVNAGKPVKVALAKEEYEPVQIGLLVAKDIAGLKVTVAGLDDLEPVVRFVEFLNQPVGPGVAKTCSPFPCDLPILPAIDLQAGACGGVWITLHATAKTAAGTRQGTLRLQAGEAQLEVPFAATVRPFTLPKPDKLYTMFMTGTYFGMQREMDLKTILPKGDADLQDMAMHGMNCASPEIWCSYMEKDGKPWFPEVEHIIDVAPGFGLDQPVFWYCGTPFETQKEKNGAVREKYDGTPSVPGHENFERREHAWTNFDHSRDIPRLKKTVAHFLEYCKAKGRPAPVYMPIDEPNIQPRNLLAVDVLKAVKAAGGTTFQTCTTRSLEKLYGDVDWITFAGAPTLAQVQAWHKDGKKVVFYDNSSISGPYHLRARVLWGFNLWRTELDGAGAWSHLTQIREYRAPDPVRHFRREARNPDNTTLPNLNWEMIREGVDDYRYVLALQQAVAQHPELKTEAEAVFAAMRKGLKDDPSRYVWSDGPLDTPATEQAPAPEQLDDWRENIAALVVKGQ